MNASRVSLATCLPIALAFSSLGARAQSSPVTLDSLAKQVAALSDQVKQLNALALRQQLNLNTLQASNDILVGKLGCVAKVSGTRDFIFEGCNVHVRNGAGTTGTTNSWGNLIIGYNKNEVSTRVGSHNLVIGDLHEYTSYGGIVSGLINTLSAPNASIISSSESNAGGSGSAIVGSNRATTNSPSAIVGGRRGVTSATASWGVVIGGNENSVTGADAVVAGGVYNVASGTHALVCGGSENSASGSAAVACGGSQNVSSGLHSATSGGAHNTAAGRASLVTGGQQCSTGANDYKWVVGAQVFPAGCTGYSN